MKQRCYNSNTINFHCYGGRGIYVCNEWLEFPVFQAWCLETYEPGKSIDRVNNDGPYSPENCRWATQKEQLSNVRLTQLKLKKIGVNLKYAVQALHKKFGNPKTRNFKICSKCKVKKFLISFHRCISSVDGRVHYCKICQKKKAQNASKPKKSSGYS